MHRCDAIAKYTMKNTWGEAAPGGQAAPRERVTQNQLWYYGSDIIGIIWSENIGIIWSENIGII